MSRARRAARRADRDGARGDGSTRARSHRGPKVPLMPALRCSCRRAYRRRMEIDSPLPGTEPPRDCPRCPRLVALRRECQAQHPDWWNAPVHAFGDPDAWLAFAGLAPGKHGANRTRRPFTGDYAGDLLFATLAEFGLSQGRYDARIDDGLTLDGAIIVNSVKCLPPQNKPIPSEIANCRPFFERQLAALPNVRVIIALGRIAHDAALRAAGERPGDRKSTRLNSS